MLSAKLAKLCVLLYLGGVTANVNLVDEAKIVFKKTEIFNENFKVHSLNIHDSRMSIVTCHDQVDSEYGRQCWIYQTVVDRNGTTDLCIFALDKDWSRVSGHSWTEETAILIAHTKENSNDQQYVQYVIINFTDCTFKHITINYESYRAVEDNFNENRNAIIINEDNTFDIFCNDAKPCSDKIFKLTVDARGIIVRESIATNQSLVHSYRAAKKGPSDSSFILKEIKFGEAYKMSLINPDGQVVLKQCHSYDDLMDHDISTAYGSIRLCSKTDTVIVECELFDEDGNVISVSTTKVSEVIDTVAVENLANDEFLLLAEGENMSSIMKVNDDGSVSGIVVLTHFACDVSGEYKSYIDIHNGEYCVIRTCFANKRLEVSKECYVDIDFH